MALSKQFDPFTFLTASREQIFRDGIKVANNRQQGILTDNMHVYDNMSRRGKTFIAREWCIAQIKESFSTDETIQCKEIWGIDGIEFDNTHFLRFKKIERPDIAIDEPRKIKEARAKARQQNFFDVIGDGEPPAEVIFGKLHHIVGGYIKNPAGIITAFYFIYQLDDRLDYHQLDLMPVINRVDRTSQQPPSPVIKLKDSVKKRDIPNG